MIDFILLNLIKRRYSKAFCSRIFPNFMLNVVKEIHSPVGVIRRLKQVTAKKLKIYVILHAPYNKLQIDFMQVSAVS